MDNENENPDMPKRRDSFYVDMFDRRNRFTLFSFLYGILMVRLRWTFYGFVPALVLFLSCGFIRVGIKNGTLDEIGTFFAITVVAVAVLSFCIWFYCYAPYWYLNNVDQDWETVKSYVEKNGHCFPDSFYSPFLPDESRNLFLSDFDESSKPTDGFIVGSLRFLVGTVWYLETVYWQKDDDGLLFYGERMNINVPYFSIRRVAKGLTPLNIVLKLDQRYTDIYAEIDLYMGHSRTFVADWRLRNVLFEQIRNECGQIQDV